MGRHLCALSVLCGSEPLPGVLIAHGFDIDEVIDAVKMQRDFDGIIDGLCCIVPSLDKRRIKETLKIKVKRVVLRRLF